MPEIFEVVLWCAALATWLMLLFALVSKTLKQLSKSIRRAIEEAFKPDLSDLGYDARSKLNRPAPVTKINIAPPMIETFFKKWLY